MPKKIGNTLVQVKMDSDTAKLLKQLAHIERESRSAFLRRVIRERGYAIGLWPPSLAHKAANGRAIAGAGN
ncbi:MAG: CopG family transcriptional regulator [Chloroflexi bacterium]|nr:CopG family transcriptional regulator [Chloroflexota bacterium]